MIRWMCRSTVIHLFILLFPFVFLKFEMLLGRLEPDGKRKVRKYDHFMVVEKWQFTTFCKISFCLSFVNNNFIVLFCHSLVALTSFTKIH